jgi:hypothetical protein
MLHSLVIDKPWHELLLLLPLLLPLLLLLPLTARCA